MISWKKSLSALCLLAGSLTQLAIASELDAIVDASPTTQPTHQTTAAPSSEEDGEQRTLKDTITKQKLIVQEILASLRAAKIKGDKARVIMNAGTLNAVGPGFGIAGLGGAFLIGHTRNTPPKTAKFVFITGTMIIATGIIMYLGGSCMLEISRDERDVLVERLEVALNKLLANEKMLEQLAE